MRSFIIDYNDNVVHQTVFACSQATFENLKGFFKGKPIIVKGDLDEYWETESQKVLQENNCEIVQISSIYNKTTISPISKK